MKQESQEEQNMKSKNKKQKKWTSIEQASVAGTLQMSIRTASVSNTSLMIFVVSFSSRMEVKGQQAYTDQNVENTLQKLLEIQLLLSFYK